MYKFIHFCSSKSYFEFRGKKCACEMWSSNYHKYNCTLNNEGIEKRKKDILPIGNYSEKVIIYFDKTEKMLFQFETFVSSTSTDWQGFTGAYNANDAFNIQLANTIKLSYPLERGGYNHFIIS